ncbi:hypothetical protein HU200_066195 [Digitaria exilis]|uniref:Uncharacterized protein n=1 Tax=Digitaria exilis TaxID=1010633 RepID=A0A834ZX01_9POAL|nr:hypothetical protein HU200_066195 [Digitaria exilis]
MCQSSVARR